MTHLSIQSNCYPVPNHAIIPTNLFPCVALSCTTLGLHILRLILTRTLYKVLGFFAASGHWKVSCINIECFYPESSVFLDQKKYLWVSVHLKSTLLFRPSCNICPQTLSIWTFFVEVIFPQKSDVMLCLCITSCYFLSVPNESDTFSFTPCLISRYSMTVYQLKKEAPV